MKTYSSFWPNEVESGSGRSGTLRLAFAAWPTNPTPNIMSIHCRGKKGGPHQSQITRVDGMKGMAGRIFKSGLGLSPGWVLNGQLALVEWHGAYFLPVSGGAFVSHIGEFWVGSDKLAHSPGVNAR